MIPIPISYGVGFSSPTQLLDYANKYREEKVGRFWNYYFTADNFVWPQEKEESPKLVIDGFSPNLNKTLHVGHLRNLALAHSLSRLFPDAASVALLGASQGILSTSLDKFKEWCSFLGYKPTIYYDVLQPWDYVKCRIIEDENDPMNGCKVWDGPKSSIIVVRSDGRPTYSFYEIAFAKNVNPTHYLTGVEQSEHFEAMGMKDKHLPMGLVLGKDGKKMKSRTGDSPSAEEILAGIKDNLKETPEPDKVAWNVLAWNFLHASRTKNVKYDPVAWTNPDAPGMYISYIYARVASAVKKLPDEFYAVYSDKYDLTESDVELLGMAAYHKYYLKRSRELMDPVQLANYAQTLALRLNLAYHQEKIVDGRYGFQFAVVEALRVLRLTMNYISMFPLEKI